MKLSKQQQQVLAILADGKVHETSTGTYVGMNGVVVAGTVATALVRRGLAKHAKMGDRDFFFGVQITKEGRALVGDDK